MKRPVFTEARVVYAGIPDSEYDAAILDDIVMKVYIAQLEQYVDFLEKKLQSTEDALDAYVKDLTNRG